jgi:hypothetical protein
MFTERDVAELLLVRYPPSPAARTAAVQRDEDVLEAVPRADLARDVDEVRGSRDVLRPA